MFTSTFKVLAVTLAALVGLVAASPAVEITNSTNAAAFGINFGTTSADDVAWVVGQSQCNNVIIGPKGANPCGRSFTLNGVSGLTFEGCGATSIYVDHNGQFYASCSTFSEADNCGVHTTWHCF